MDPRTGDTRRVRRALAVALVAAALVAGCGGDADDGAADAAPTTDGSGSSALASSSTAASTTTTTAPGDPEGSVKVPIDEALVAALPRLFDVDGIVSEDPTFDERLCDGRKAPTLPEGQARATYEVSPTETITIAAYRFAPGVGPYYLSVYSEAVRACAVEAGDSADLGLVDAVGYAFELETTRGKAFIALALREDVLWVLFQESTEGRPRVDASTLDLFLQAVEG